MKDTLQDIYDSLTEKRKTEIRAEVLRHALDRERLWNEQIEKLESRKQEIIEELEEIAWTIAENDQWFQNANSDMSVFSEDEYRTRIGMAKRLFFRRKELSETGLPSVDRELQSLLEKIQLEELREDSLQAQDFERQLEPILRKQQEDIARKKYKEWHKQKQAKEEAEQRQRRELETLIARLRERREQDELKRKEEARRVAIEQIRECVARRQIHQLVHFTPRENLQSILRDGLLSRQALTGRKFIITDDYRTDGWLDWISVSVSFPNYKMFFPKRNQISNVSGWAVLVIRPEVLWERECKFFLTNAASSEMRSFPGAHWSSSQAFNEMFGQSEYRVNIPLWYTTDPQAEVMVKDKIPNNYISRVIVDSGAEAELLAQEIGMSVEVDRSLFSWRNDHQTWKGRRLKPTKATIETVPLVP